MENYSEIPKLIEELNRFKLGCGDRGDGDVDDAYLVCGKTYWDNLPKHLREYALYDWTQEQINNSKNTIEYCSKCMWDISLVESKLETYEKCLKIALNSVISEIELLTKVESEMDLSNGDNGDESGLCLFCKSNEWNGNVGIIHKDYCLIVLLRKKLFELSSQKSEIESYLELLEKKQEIFILMPKREHQQYHAQIRREKQLNQEQEVKHGED